MLPVARLAYKTVGALNAARDNAVLVPSWYTGTHNDTETYMLGGMRALDPRRYFIILDEVCGRGSACGALDGRRRLGGGGGRRYLPGGGACASPKSASYV